MFFGLQVSHLTHSVLSQNGFKAEYKKPGGMLKLSSWGSLKIGESEGGGGVWGQYTWRFETTEIVN